MSNTALQKASYFLYLFECVKISEDYTHSIFMVPRDILLQMLYNKEDQLDDILEYMRSHRNDLILKELELLIEEICQEYRELSNI